MDMFFSLSRLTTNECMNCAAVLKVSAHQKVSKNGVHMSQKRGGKNKEVANKKREKGQKCGRGRRGATI